MAALHVHVARSHQRGAIGLLDLTSDEQIGELLSNGTGASATTSARDRSLLVRDRRPRCLPSKAKC